ncbi:hypothetical protein AbraIFM66951_004272 [Aspergillus brasiliensis]|uniref:Uncharacterized protein n=1 Tax=Aspergillus brasiliensis TaxID=319629 RepID=A0A9W6DPC0_9EURO|nr:hypothetical protein AbraCBS73388_008945 [Aspergillus brasiliensis]GKZ40603.1 hypothetical protein AbraIFM66951_004272 [Aspergillus brasiliensis]
MDPAAQRLLDSVNWTSLHHAYDVATDVPDNLRSLLSPNKSDRSDAYKALYSNIFHQTTCYEATVYAVPYLLKILESPGTPARASLISYLVDLALGLPSTFLPQGVDIVAWRQRVVGKIYTPESETEYYYYAEQARDENQRKVREYVRRVGLKQQCTNAEYELATYDAACMGVPLFQKLLEDEDVEVRAFAAYALAWFPGEAAGTGRNRSSAVALQRVLNREGGDVMVLASAIVALGMPNGCWIDSGVVSNQEIDDFICRLREYRAPKRHHSLLRFAAAVSFVRLLHHCPEDVSVLSYVLADRSFIPKSDAQKSNALGFPFHEGDLSQYSGKVLKTLNLEEYPKAMYTLLDASPRLGRVEASEFAEVVLELAFGPRPEDEDRRPAESLTETQRQTVITLAEL